MPAVLKRLPIEDLEICKMVAWLSEIGYRTDGEYYEMKGRKMENGELRECN